MEAKLRLIASSLRRRYRVRSRKVGTRMDIDLSIGLSDFAGGALDVSF